MEQVLPFPQEGSFLVDENEELRLQNSLNRLASRKMSWDQFLEGVKNLSLVSRLSSSETEQTLLHLAVLENRLDVIKTLKSQPHLKLKRNAIGLNSLELAQLLGRKEALQILQPLSEEPSLPGMPRLDGFEYLTHPVFETIEGFEQILSLVSKAKREDRIPAEKIWMGIYFDKEIRKGVYPPISIQHIDSEIGYGVFADKKISPCTFVGEYTGVIQQKSPAQLKEKVHCLRYTSWEGKKNFVIDAEKKGNFTRFINHSSKPNLGLQAVYWQGIPRMIFVALKEIPEGSQLTFDYGPLFWKELRQTPLSFDEN